MNKIAPAADDRVRDNEPKSDRKRQKRLEQRLHLQWCDEASDAYAAAKASGHSEEEAKKIAQEVNQKNQSPKNRVNKHERGDCTKDSEELASTTGSEDGAGAPCIYGTASPAKEYPWRKRLVAERSI